MATEVEKACEFFDGCHKNSASDRDVWYYIGVLLCSMNDGIGDIATPELSFPDPVARVPSITTVSVDGTVAAGSRMVEFLLSSDFDGTIDGEAFLGSAWETVGPFQADMNNTLGVISYTITAGSLQILKVV